MKNKIEEIKKEWEKIGFTFIGNDLEEQFETKYKTTLFRAMQDGLEHSFAIDEEEHMLDYMEEVTEFLVLRIVMEDTEFFCEGLGKKQEWAKYPGWFLKAVDFYYDKLTISFKPSLSLKYEVLKEVPKHLSTGELSNQTLFTKQEWSEYELTNVFDKTKASRDALKIANMKMVETGNEIIEQEIYQTITKNTSRLIEETFWLQKNKTQRLK